MQEVTEEYGVCVVSFDRAGYGQSDADPNRSIKSAADDVVDLADALGLGRRFYVTAVSIGGYTGWGLLKYYPDRLAGMAMQAPATNYWWSGLPASAVKAAWAKLAFGDKMALYVWHYFPLLTYWHMTQTWLPTSSVAPHTGIQSFSLMDQEIMKQSGARLAKTTPEVQTSSL
jgi:pimeloyl-ACP methyl ester carboxylesterase